MRVFALSGQRRGQLGVVVPRPEEGVSIPGDHVRVQHARLGPPLSRMTSDHKFVAGPRAQRQPPTEQERDRGGIGETGKDEASVRFLKVEAEDGAQLGRVGRISTLEASRAYAQEEGG